MFNMSEKRDTEKKHSKNGTSGQDTVKFLTISMVISLLIIMPAHALVDNFYFTMPPDASRCFSVRLPIDLNTLTRGYCTLNTSSDFPMNLKFIKTFAEAVNIVKVPLCFYSEGKRDGDFAYYRIMAEALGLHKEFNGGICVSGTQDVESRKLAEGRSPCDLINGYEDLFYIAFLEPVQWALPGTRINYTLLIQSMKPLELEVTFESGLQVSPQRVSVKIPKGGRAEPVSLEVRAPGSGEHDIRAKARVKTADGYCDIPFCEMEARARLIAGGAARPGFDLLVFPQFLSVDFAKPVPYTVFIENSGQEAGFIVQIELPEGLEADWTRKVISVSKGERKELPLNITPQIREAGDYMITFTASSGGIERVQEAYLSVRETESDILRRWNAINGSMPEAGREKLQFEVDRFVADYRMKGFDFEDYKKMDRLLKEAENMTGPLPEGRKEEPEALNPVLIAIPVAVIILILIFMFYKKSKPLEEMKEEF